MFIGGKNNNPGNRMATAYLAYDCTHDIICGAAHLDAEYMASNPLVHIKKWDGENWIRIGASASDPKLKRSNADEFKFVGKPLDSDFTIGWEGCWYTSGLGASIMNNFVEVHFLTLKGDTIR
jgi:hypothetical protein